MKGIIALCLILVISAIFITWFLYGEEPPCREVNSVLDDFSKLSFDILREINSYVISLSTLLIGGLAVFVMKNNSILDVKTNKMNRTLISISGIFSTASLYCSLIFYNNLAEAAINGCAQLNEKINITYSMQVSFLSISAVFFLLLIFSYLGYERHRND